MSQFFDWVAVALFVSMLAIGLIGFRTDRRWWMRPVFAFATLAVAVMTLALAWYFAHGGTLGLASSEGLGVLALAVMMWIAVIGYARRPLDPGQAATEKRRWGCTRTALAIIAIVVVGYAMFVLLVFAIGAAIAVLQ